MAGIKDIAKKAQVSISTVSYALNNNPKIPEATRLRIAKIAQEMNYVPNRAGRNLKRKQTNIIGVYLTNYGGSFYGVLIQGITQRLQEHGYEVIVCSGEKSHVFLPERMIDGAIILDATYASEEITRYINDNYKIVVLDREFADPHICHVLIDNAKGAQQAVTYLLQQQPKRFVLVTGPEHTYDSQKRLKHALATLKQEKFENVDVLQGDFTKQSGYEAAAHIHKEMKTKTAVFCLNDEMAIGMYDYFRSTSVTIGKELLLMGFDHSELSRYMIPRLASIDYSMSRWGTVAADKILHLLNEGKAENAIIDTALIEGGSVDGTSR